MSLKDQKTSEIVAIYNENAETLGEKPVKRFATRAAAIKRTEAIVERRKAAQAGGTSDPAAKTNPAPKPVKKAGTPNAKAKRVLSDRMDFNMAGDPTGIRKLRIPKDVNKPSMRYRVTEMLSVGTTFADIKAYCETRSGKTSDAIIYNRIRNINLICGFGVVHNKETGELKLAEGEIVSAISDQVGSDM